MKFRYIIFIITVICVFVNSTTAQDKIIRDQDEISPIARFGPEDPIDISFPNLACFCFYSSDFTRFQSSLDETTHTDFLWFKGQELAMKKEIEKRLNKQFDDFRNAQSAFFFKFSPNRLIQNYEDKVENYVEDNFQYNTGKIRNSEARFRTIQNWRYELGRINGGNSRQYYFGDLTYSNSMVNNVKIESIRRVYDLIAHEREERNLFESENNKRINRLSWDKKVQNAKNSNAYRKWIADQFVNYYNGLDYRDAIRVMSIYMISDFSNNSSVVLPPSNFFNQNVWWPNNQDLTSNMIAVTQNQSGGTIRDLSALSTDDAIARYAFNNMGSQNSSFILGNQNMALSAKGYLKYQKYKNAALDNIENAVDGYIKNELRSDWENRHFFSGTANNLPEDYGVDLAYKFTYTVHGETDGLRTLSNFYYDLYNVDTEHYLLEGHRIKLALIASNTSLNLSNVSKEDLGRLFNFSTIYPFGNFNYNFFLEYNIKIADILNHHNISLQNLLQNAPLLSMFSSISENYQANKISYDTLSVILNYLKNVDLSTQTIQSIQNILNILITNPDVNNIDELNSFLANRNEIFYVEGGTRKVNPTRETRCFDLNKAAKVTIYVEQPIEGSRTITADIGHTFVGIEQDGIKRYLGFYPDSRYATLLKPQKSEIHDNSGSEYHVSISTQVTPDQLKRIINDINNFPKTYDLNKYNCSDFGIQIGRKAGLNLPAKIGTYSQLFFTFEGRNPADLGEDIREMQDTNTISIDRQGGNAPQKSGGC